MVGPPSFAPFTIVQRGAFDLPALKLKQDLSNSAELRWSGIVDAVDHGLCDLTDNKLALKPRLADVVKSPGDARLIAAELESVDALPEVCEGIHGLSSLDVGDESAGSRLWSGQECS
jgi:hypothetical protein